MNHSVGMITPTYKQYCSHECSRLLRWPIARGIENKLLTALQVSICVFVGDVVLSSFTVPKSYNDLVSLLEKYTATEQNTVLERMRKCNHASLAAENKDLLVVS